MPGPIVPAAIMLAGRAATMGGGKLIPSLTATSAGSQVLKFLGAGAAIEAVDTVLEMFGVDIIPDFESSTQGAEAVVLAAQSVEDSMVPAFRPPQIPDEWDLPGYYWVYSFKDHRSWWSWTYRTKKSVTNAVTRALTPKTTIRSTSSSRSRK